MGPDRPLGTPVSEDNSQEVAQGTLGHPEVGFSLSRQLGKWPRHHLWDGRVRAPLSGSGGSLWVCVLWAVDWEEKAGCGATRDVGASSRHPREHTKIKPPGLGPSC